MSEQKTAYPLYWPEGWPRTSPRHWARFSRQCTVATARELLSKELDLLGAAQPLLSTNLELRLDGQPRSNTAAPRDPGAAVYFQFRGRQVALACDRWQRVEHNIHAIALHIAALRGQQRWGVGNLEQAFRGYMALPAAGQTTGMNPHQVLGLAINATEPQIRDAYRRLAAQYHPDNQATGNAAKFLQVKRAHDLLLQNA